MDLHSMLVQAFQEKRTITSRDLQRALGMSRQAVWQHLRRLVELGALVPEGVGRGVRYRPGLGVVETAVTGYSDAAKEGFWSELVQRAPVVSYRSVYFASREAWRKADAVRLVRGVPFGGFLVLDFDRVERVGEAFAHEVFAGPSASSYRVLAINASPSVCRTLARVCKSDELWRSTRPD